MSDGVTITTSVIENKVASDRWTEMNFSELLNQKNILFQRYEYLLQIESPAASKLLEGINNLDSLIAQKSLK